MTPTNFDVGVSAMLKAIIVVMVGGALGSAARFLVTHLSSDLSRHHGFPFGTLVVNILGSFAVGCILTWSSDHSRDHWRLLAATGFCGGFTTFSAFTYETMAYLNSGRFILFAVNIALNNMLSFFAVLFGIRLHG
jgi:fluoride exporter